MFKEVISDREGISLIILFSLGATLALPSAAKAGSDAWIATLLATISFIPMALAYGRILVLFPGKDLFDILDELLGKLLGKAIGLIFIWFAFHIGLYGIRDAGDFITTVSLEDTPGAIPMVFAGFLSIWIVKEGIETMGRWAVFFFTLIALIPPIVVLMMAPQMELDNILPIFYGGIKPLLRGTLSVLTLPLGETVIFLMAFSSFRTKESPYRIFIMGVLIGGAIVFIATLAEILVLGPDIFQATYLPSHNALSKISIGDLLERLEVVAIVTVYIANFIKSSICLLAVSKGLAKLFNFKDYRFIIVPVGLNLINFAIFFHDNIIDSLEWTRQVWDFYAIPFQFILPLGILALGEIRRRSNKIGGESSG